MNKYSVQLEVWLEVEAFDQDDARDYVNDIFGLDDEVRSIKIIDLKENRR